VADGGIFSFVFGMVAPASKKKNELGKIRLEAWRSIRRLIC
jgi:hypothetical protein